MNVTFDKISALASAGFTKQEIAQMLGSNEQPAQEQKKQSAQRAEQTKQENDFATLLQQMSDRMAKLEEQLSALPQTDQKPKTQETNKVLELLQSINVSNQKYDLPPQYNVEEALAKHYTAIMNGDNRESEDKNNGK